MQNPPIALSKKRRPAGVIVLAILYLVGSLIALCFVLPRLSSLSVPPNFEAASILAYEEFLLWCTTVCGLITAVGLWLVAEWARWLAIALAATGVLTLLLTNASVAVTGSMLLQVLSSLAVIVYLVQPGVRKAFAG